MSRAEHIRRAVQSLDGFPALPQVVAESWRSDADDEAFAAALRRLVEHDRSHRVDFLRVAASQYFGASGVSRSVRGAVDHMGVKNARDVILAVIVRRAFVTRARPPRVLGRLDFWRHAIGSGIAAEIIAGAVRLPEIELAFAAGFLHDIGIMVMERLEPAALSAFVQRVSSGQSIEEAEDAVLGCSHGEVGRWLAEAWKLPTPLVHAIAHHHSALAAPSACQRLASVVGLADSIMSPAARVVYGGGAPDAVVLARLGLDVPNLLRIRELALLRLGHAADWLSPGRAGERRAAA